MNKNKFFSQLKKETHRIRLTSKEREVMRSALLKAIAKPRLVKSPFRVSPSPYLFISSKLVTPLAFVLILAVIGGGTAYAAEAAVPGDALYTIKVNVNEKVVEALAASTEAKAAVHAKLAERRMKEAEVLVERGALTRDAKEEIETRLDSHATELDIAVEVVGREDPVAAAELSTRLGSALAAHSALITRLGEEADDEGSREESRRFASSLRERGKRLARAEDGVAVMAMRSDGDIAVQTFAKSGESSVSASVTVRGDTDDSVAIQLRRNASSTLEEAEIKLKALKNVNATTAARVKAQIGKTRERIKNLGKDDKEGFEKALKDAKTLQVFIEAQEEFQTRAILPAPDIEENGEEDNSGHGSDDDHENTSLTAPLPL